MTKKKSVKFVLIFMVILLGASIVFASDTPCTDMWSACVNLLGYPNIFCNLLWELCIAILY